MGIVRFVLWKDEGDLGKMFLLEEDPDLPRPFVFKAGPARDYEWISKKDAKALARRIGAEFREG